MDIRQLRYFLKVCEYGSILQASHRVYLSQQSLSKNISSMENEIGLQLFERTPKGIILTNAGKRLQTLALSVIESMDTLTREMAQLSEHPCTQLRIGVASTFQFFVGYDFVDKLSLLMSSPTEISLTEYPFDVCERLVEKGDLSAAITVGPIPNLEVEAIHLLKCQRVAVIPKSSPLSTKQQISIKDLDGCKLVVNINKRNYNQFISLCNSQGFAPDLFSVGENTTMFSFCNECGYIGLTIDFLFPRITTAYENIIAVPIDPNEFSHQLVLVINREQYNKKTVQEMARHIHDIVLSKNKT